MYYMQSERRAMFLANYAREHEKVIQERRDRFRFSVTSIRYSENEIMSSIRAHADEDHLQATARAARLTRRQLGQSKGVEGIINGVDIEQAAEDFAERTDRMRDQDAYRRVQKKAVEYIGE